MKKTAQYIDFISMILAVIGGVWLLILGAWQLVVIGLIYGFFGMYLIALLSIPQSIFTTPAQSMLKKKKVLSSGLLFVVGSLYIFGIFALSSYGITALTQRATENNHSLFVPVLIWLFVILMMPWLRLNSKAQSQETIATTRGTVLLASCLTIFLVSVLLTSIQVAIWILIASTIALAIVDGLTEFKYVHTKVS